MKLVEEGFDFEFRSPQQKGNPVRIPTIATLDLVNLAREILDTTRAEEEGGNFRRFKEKIGTTTMEEQTASTSALADSPTSRFTAVNGKEPPPVAGNGSSRRGSDERSNGQPRVTPPGQERLTITTITNQREHWAVPVNGEPYPPVTYSEVESTHKRKRSGSIEHNSSSANSYHSHALPSSTKETPTTASTEPDISREDILRGQPLPQPDVRDSYNADADYRRYLAAAEESREMAHNNDPWSRQYPSQHLTSDEHLGEVLQRASQNMDSHHRHEYEQDSPGDADRSANPYSAYGHDRREMSASSDPKKRKRNFSNRTKTGCMTCRRRKKKCDETRPECT